MIRTTCSGFALLGLICIGFDIFVISACGQRDNSFQKAIDADVAFAKSTAVEGRAVDDVAADLSANGWSCNKNYIPTRGEFLAARERNAPGSYPGLTTLTITVNDDGRVKEARVVTQYKGP